MAQERLSIARDGSVIYRFRRPWRNGKRAVVMDPMTFLSRLAALVPPPRFHMLSYYGVLAPAAARRDEIVPGAHDQEELASCHKQTSRAPHAESGAGSKQPARRHPERLSWAELLKRVWLEDILRCPCGGKRQVLAMVFNPESIERILRHLGLPHQPPTRAPPRAMQRELGFPG